MKQLIMRRLYYLLFLYVFHFIFCITPHNSFRIFYLRLLGAKIGPNNFISRKVRFDFPWRLVIGDNNYISDYAYLDCRGGIISIGNLTDISSHVSIYTVTHDINSRDFCVQTGGVTISSRCWICTRTIILPNSSVMDGCVIGANSVFSNNSEKNSLYVGVPAIYIKLLPKNRAIHTRRFS